MTYFTETTRRAAEAAVRAALAEDLDAAGDITSNAVIPPQAAARGRYLFREAAVVAGAGVVVEVCRQVSGDILIEVLRGDGERVRDGEAAMELSGPARAVLAVERTSLNFLSHLSGVATATRAYVDAVAGTTAAIYDTRKTIPGLRVLEKYAVRCGGGHNHRIGLYDQVLIKDNHLALARRADPARTMAEMVAAARKHSPAGTVVEIETETLDDVRAALASGADVIMLDNMPPGMMREAVSLRASYGREWAVFEASGGITLSNVAAAASTGVERISIGAITHSARGVDISLEID